MMSKLKRFWTALLVTAIFLDCLMAINFLMEGYNTYAVLVILCAFLCWLGIPLEPTPEAEYNDKDPWF